MKEKEAVDYLQNSEQMKRALWLIAVALARNEPKLVNAKLDTPARRAWRNLPAVSPRSPSRGRLQRAFDPHLHGLRLRRDGFNQSINQAGVVHLEPPDHAVVLSASMAATSSASAPLAGLRDDAGDLPCTGFPTKPAERRPSQYLRYPARRYMDSAITRSPCTPTQQPMRPSASPPISRESIRLRVVGWHTSRGRRGYDAPKNLITRPQRASGARHLHAG